MEFCEKLDLLMNVTGTTNSALAQNVKLDASHISRLRRGQRRALRNKSCISAISAFFAGRCNESYRKKAVFDAMELTRDVKDTGELQSLISSWLSDDRSGGTRKVDNFLAGLTKTPAGDARPLQAKELGASAPEPLPEYAAFYGNAGKREAVIRFLNAVLAAPKPVTLLLFSGEATDWMTESREFAGRWAALMGAVLSRGNRIVIIHTVSRDLDEMLAAISQWMPLYMSGVIEPYFYPKKRDGIFKRTLFVAPGTAAVVSNSVGRSGERAANLLFGDKAAVAAYEYEFLQYLAMCKPLMKIFTQRDKDACFDMLLEFEREPCDAIIKTESLSLLTMPEGVLADIAARTGIDGGVSADRRHMRAGLFENLLATRRFTEILRLPDLGLVMEGRLPVSLSAMFAGGAARYTPQEYLRHLKHFVRLLETYENFCVRLSPETPGNGYMVYAKEDYGVLVAKTGEPVVVLSMRESGITAAFWDFLWDITGSREYSPADRAATLRKLVGYIRRLEAKIEGEKQPGGR
ncbi:MAG TPA: hypothetical protein VN446_08845 [Candidatus Acidoferrum sp.]|nr:hypothetical protein [Candidatus Acidoferrum sp.]